MILKYMYNNLVPPTQYFKISKFDHVQNAEHEKPWRVNFNGKCYKIITDDGEWSEHTTDQK